MLVLTRSEPQPFTDKQIELLTTFADQAVIAIENIRLFEAEQQRTRELTGVRWNSRPRHPRCSRSSPALRATSNRYLTMLEKAVRICDAKFGSIYRWDGDAFDLVATHNVPPAFAERRRSRLRPNPGLPPLAWWRLNGSSRCRCGGRTNLHSYNVIHTSSRPWNLAVYADGYGRPNAKRERADRCDPVPRQEVRPFTDKQIELVTNLPPKRSSR